MFACSNITIVIIIIIIIILVVSSFFSSFIYKRQNGCFRTLSRLKLSLPVKHLGWKEKGRTFVKAHDVRRSVCLNLVRPLFGYATQIWAPQFIKLITRIERTQRRATNICSQLPFSCTISYMDRLKSLDLLPLTLWHEYLDMMFFFFFSKPFMISYR